MKLRVGQTLYSSVDDATVVVIRAPEDDATVNYGGAEMTDVKPDAAGSGAQSGEGMLLGKRYADDETGMEVLCTKAGAGALTIGGRPIGAKEAKKLPASD